ncbi:O-antigen ligase family protein [Mycobacterium sp. NPDC051804]|uniref:O-antigen ligase family protein n=1 Tax=Mycobacterium sp. NPDC051804 TaxID=3364295 RepID=UPI0037989476
MIKLTRPVVPASEIPGFILAAVVATVGALVVLGSRDPVLLLAAQVGAIGFVFAARRPLLALIAIVVMEVTNVSGVLTPRTGIPFFHAALLLGLLAVGFALRDPNARQRLNAWTVLSAGFMLVYLATQAVATVGSVDLSTSLASLIRATLDCVFVMLVLILIQLTGRPWMVAGAIVIPLAVLSSLTIVNELVFNGGVSFGGFATVARHSGKLITDIATHRYGGPLPDSNFWGRYLVMGLPLAAALLTRAQRSGRRSEVVLWLPPVVLLLGGIYLTQSRGTFFTAGIAIVVWFVASERSVRRRGLAMLPVALLIFAVPGIGNRLVGAFADLSQSKVNFNIDPSVLNRLAAQEEAWMMFEERPYFGFGPGTFPGLVIDFAGRVPTAARNPTDAPHNLYAEFAAGSGVFGLLGLAVLILGFLSLVVLRIVVQPRSVDRILAAAVCAAIVAWSVASIGLHLTYFRMFGIVLALAAGLAPAWPLPVDVMRRLLDRLAVLLVAGVLGFSAFWLSLSVTSSPAFTATQRVTLVPVGPMDGWYAYALDIRSRVELLPTFAVVMHDQSSPVSITADPVRGVLKLTATADSADEARDQIQLAAAHADAAMHAASSYQQYSLQTVGSMQIVPSRQRSSLALVVSGGVGAVTALAAGMALSRVLARRRMDESAIEPSRGDSVPV